jgi:PKD repeat protein
MPIIRKRKNWILGIFLFLIVFVAMQEFVNVNRVVGNEPPVIILHVSSNIIDEGETLTLDVSDSYDPEGKSLYFSWKFGTDTSWGAWSSKLTRSMVLYDSTKNPITIMAKVSDSLLEASTQTSITVNNLPPVVEACPDIVAYNGTEVSFDGSYSDPGNDRITLKKWDFGDGESIETVNVRVKHVYELPGEYTATLTVEDAEGASASDTVAVSIVESFHPLILQLCTSDGTPADHFSNYPDSTGPPYVKGSGLPNQELPFYVVYCFRSWEDGVLLSDLTWADGILIIADSQGNIPLTKISDTNGFYGDYDIFVDVNNNEVYDEDVDVVFHSAINYIPEGQYGALATALILAVFAIVLIKQKKHLKSKSLERDDVT